jgi:hypothetical protein
VGPYWAFRLKARLVHSSGSTDENDDIKKNDSGLIFGGCLEFKVKTLNLLVDARYSVGRKNILEDPLDDESIKNKGFVLMLGLKF